MVLLCISLRECAKICDNFQGCVALRGTSLPSLNDGGTTEGIPTSTTSVCYTRPEEIPATTTLATTTTSVSTTSPEIDFGNLPAEIGGFNLLFVGTALLAGTLA